MNDSKVPYPLNPPIGVLALLTMTTSLVAKDLAVVENFRCRTPFIIFDFQTFISVVFVFLFALEIRDLTHQHKCGRNYYNSIFFIFVVFANEYF